MPLIENFLSDLKLQADRDLKGAELVLMHEGPIELVGWLCEQSFEKTVKYVYAYYKLRIQNNPLDSVYEKLKEKSHLGAYELIINMMREIFRDFWDNFWQSFLTRDVFPEHLKNAMIDNLKKSKISIMAQMEKIIDDGATTIGALTQNIEKYDVWLKQSPAEWMQEYMGQFDYANTVATMTNPIIVDMKKAAGPDFSKIVSSTFSPQFLQSFFAFAIRSMALAVRVLPYFETSRYPAKDFNYSNLRLFREYESELRPYFAYLVQELRNFNVAADNFIKDFFSILKTDQK